MKTKKKHPIRNFFLILLLVLVVGVAAVVIWQWDNIQVLILAATTSYEELEEKLTANDERIQNVVKENENIVVRTELAEEEKQALRDGTMTSEELVEVLVTPEEGVELTEYQEEVSTEVAKVVVLREELTIELEKMKTEAVEEINQLMEESKTADLAEVALSYVEKAEDLEKVCDEKIETIVENLDIIQEENGDMELLSETILEIYEEEKDLVKAMVMAELAKRGLV